MDSDFTVLVSNDDGIYSSGILALAQAAERLGKVKIVAPTSQQTAQGKSLTFNKPIRFERIQELEGEAIGHNGSPADSIVIHHHFEGSNPSIILSGINGGENTSIHSILTSGTCGVAMEGGLRNIPSFAISLDVPEEYFFAKSLPFDLSLIAKLAVDLSEVLYHAPREFWEKVLFVNINFPHKVTESTKIEVVGLETYKYKNYLVERTDPKGLTYFWLWGNKRDDWDSTKDSYKVLFEDTITVTPVTFGVFDESLQVTDQILRESSLAKLIK